MQDLFKKIGPHAIVIAVFAALVAIYFSPIIFEGKQIKQSDTVQWAGAQAEIYHHREKYGEEALWTNSVFGGMPAYVISVIYPGEWVEALDKLMSGGFPHPVAVFFVGLVCYYIMLLSFGLSPALAALGAIGFTFFSYNFVSIEAGHNSKVRAMTFAPLLIAGINLAFRNKLLWGMALAALGTALQIRSGHFQITYYVAFIVAILGVNELIWAIKDGKLPAFTKAAGALILAGLIGVGANAARLWVVQEYTQYSMRGKPELIVKDVNKPTDGGLDRDYVFSWSNGKMENFTLLIPGLMGGSTTEKIEKKSNVAKAFNSAGLDLSQYGYQMPLYWGPQPFTSGPVYAGAVIIFLFILGMFIIDLRYRYAILVGTILSLMLATGKNLEWFNYLMYDYFPAYSKFRTVTMSLFIAQIFIPLGAALAAHKILSEAKDEALRKKLYMAAGITAGLCLLFLIAPGIAGDFSSENDVRQGIQGQMASIFEEARQSLLKADAMRSLIFVVLAAAVCLIPAFTKIPVWIAGLMLAALSLFDLWGVNTRYLDKGSFEKGYMKTMFEPTASDQRIMADKSQYRVLNLQNPFNETKTSYFHHSIGGYSPVKLRRYQDLIENDISFEIEATIKTLQSGSFTPDSLAKNTVLNMLNTKYIKYGDEANAVIPNPNAYGNAWFIHKLIPTASPNEELDALRALEDPKNTAVFDVKKFPTLKTSYPEGNQQSVVLSDYKANQLTYEIETDTEGLINFSEIYYPAGWIATLNDQEVPIHRVNYLFRAVEVPAGKHKLVMSFKPDSFFVGNNISRVSSILIYCLIGMALFVAFREKKQE